MKPIEGGGEENRGSLLLLLGTLLFVVLPNPTSGQTLEAGTKPWNNDTSADMELILRRTLLHASEYDPGVAPPMRPVQVKVTIRFNKVEKVSVAEHRMSINVWLRMQWRDDRLSWNASEFANIDYLSFSAVPGKQSSSLLWTPDLELNQQEASIRDLTIQDAQVFSDGRVYWSRPGSLKVLCSFTGIQRFPFRPISCTFDMNGWSEGGDKVDYVFLDGGSSLSLIHI